MILGDSEIKRMMAEGYFPAYPKLLINPASMNVRIGASFLVPRRKWFGSVALGDEVKYKKIVLQKGKAFKLRPGQFALATTIESINLPLRLAAFVQGRSSIGRAGLTVQNAGFIDPGFHGHITLELKNETKNTILIRPGYPVAQIVFEQAQGVERPYTGKYCGQTEATGSRMHLDKIPR